MDEQLTHMQAKAIVAASRHYRDAMHRYLAERTAVLDDRATCDDLVTHIWVSFREAMQAERDLFVLLDALDTAQPHERGLTLT